MTGFDDLLAVQPPAASQASTEGGQVPDPSHTDPASEDETGTEAAQPDSSVTEPGSDTPAAAVPEPEPPAPEQDEKPKAAKRTSDDRPDRSESMKRRHRDALDAVFGVPGTKFEVLEEVHLGADDPKFKTPFGNTGRHGWVIREVGNGTGALHTIGANALKIAIHEYKVIDPLPRKPRGRKPKDDASEDNAAEQEQVAS